MSRNDLTIVNNGIIPMWDDNSMRYVDVSVCAGMCIDVKVQGQRSKMVVIYGFNSSKPDMVCCEAKDSKRWYSKRSVNRIYADKLKIVKHEPK